MAYSTVGDMLLGDMPASTRHDPQKFVNDATDEIDSKIGHIYATPIDVTDPTDVARHSVLLLKRINNFLATGRYILARAAGDEDSQINAYGRSLIEEALLAIQAIVDGTIVLEGAVEEGDGSGAGDGPSITNYDTISAVDAFYERVMVPETGWPGPYPYRDWAPGSNPNGTLAP
jgi:phage gp36-like protein